MTPRGALAKGLLVLGSTVVTLLAVEAGFRLRYREAWYELISERRTYPYRLNADRLRDKDYGPKAPETYRILILGDSFTFGLGVPDEQAPFPRILERRLDELAPRPGPNCYEVYNAGIPGALTHHWVGMLPKLRDKFQPDLVIVVFFLRDGSLTGSIGLFSAIREAMAAERKNDALARYSYAYRFFHERAILARLSAEYFHLLKRSYFGSTDETLEWREAQKNLVELKEQAEGKGAAFELVVFPVLYELHAGYPFQDVCDLIESFCRDHGIAHDSFLPAFMGQDAQNLWVSPYDQHPNAKAHAIAAEALVSIVERLMNEGSRRRAR